MKELSKHIIDASLGAAISFFTAVSVMDEFSTKALMYAVVSGMLVGLIKLREYNLSKRGNMSFIFIR